MPIYVALIGDSVFDNAAYVNGGADVLTHLKRLLPGGSTAELLAVDGSVMADVPTQLERLAAGTTHMVASIGGNDALRASSVLSARSQSVGESLLQLAAVKEQFCAAYASTLDRLQALKLPMAVCTIYDVRYPEPAQRRVAATALSILNDCITRVAAERGVSLLDLRVMCNEDADFANPIEPSVQGGRKIAGAIASFVSSDLNRNGRSELIVK
jgi:GDSL-like Lipase/Acylhydrolase family